MRLPDTRRRACHPLIPHKFFLCGKIGSLCAVVFGCHFRTTGNPTFPRGIPGVSVAEKPAEFRAVLPRLALHPVTPLGCFLGKSMTGYEAAAGVESLLFVCVGNFTETSELRCAILALLCRFGAVVTFASQPRLFSFAYCSLSARRRQEKSCYTSTMNEIVCPKCGGGMVHLYGYAGYHCKACEPNLKWGRQENHEPPPAPIDGQTPEEAQDAG